MVSGCYRDQDLEPVGDEGDVVPADGGACLAHAPDDAVVEGHRQLELVGGEGGRRHEVVEIQRAPGG